MPRSFISPPAPTLAPPSSPAVESTAPEEQRIASMGPQPQLEDPISPFCYGAGERQAQDLHKLEPSKKETLGNAYLPVWCSNLERPP